MLVCYGARLCRNAMNLKFSGNVLFLRKTPLEFNRQIHPKERLKHSGKSLVHCISQGFHTSPPQHVHPVVLLLMKPLMRGAAMLSGWMFRLWWRELPAEKKRQFFTNLWRHRPKFAVGVGCFCGALAFYYYEHLYETPITKRRRFLALTPSQFNTISNEIFKEQLEEFRGNLLHKAHHKTQRVARVANRLLSSNKDITEIHDKTWAVTVVDSHIRNAFVLPTGQIFVFAGMLDVCVNDDQLGGILAHEMAHCILSHGAEQISFAHLFDWVAVVFIAAIWAFLPSNTLASLTHWIFEKVTTLLFHLPYNRKLESEADSVGLILAAKACFDIREISALWTRIAVTEKVVEGVDLPDIEWLSTHPTHENRTAYLDEKIPEALELRNSCGCPKLAGADPRDEVTKFKETVEKYLQEKQKEKANEQVVLVLKKPGL